MHKPESVRVAMTFKVRVELVVDLDTEWPRPVGSGVVVGQRSER